MGTLPRPSSTTTMLMLPLNCVTKSESLIGLWFNMRNRKFANHDHAYSYLCGSIIRIGEVPVYIHDMCDWSLYHKPLNEYDSYNVKCSITKLDDPAVDMNPVPLGFLSPKTTTDVPSFYVKRNPFRQWKQGLTTQNCTISNPFKHEIDAPANLVPKYYLFSTAMVRAILNHYLPPEDAQKLSKVDNRPAAFSRRFAVFKDYLLYKDLGEPVGTVARGKPELHEDFTYLTSALNEDLNACSEC